MTRCCVPNVGFSQTSNGSFIYYIETRFICFPFTLHRYTLRFVSIQNSTFYPLSRDLSTARRDYTLFTLNTEPGPTNKPLEIARVAIAKCVQPIR